VKERQNLYQLVVDEETDLSIEKRKLVEQLAKVSCQIEIRMDLKKRGESLRKPFCQILAQL